MFCYGGGCGSSGATGGQSPPKKLYINNRLFAEVSSFHDSSKRKSTTPINPINRPCVILHWEGQEWNKCLLHGGFSGEVGTGSVNTHCKISYRSCKRLIFRVWIAFMPYLVPFKLKNRSQKSQGKISENSFLLQTLYEYF